MRVELPLGHLAELWPAQLRGARVGALLHPASSSHRNPDRRPHRIGLWSLGCGLILWATAVTALPADVPWLEVTRHLALENGKLSRRPGGHAGEYLFVCTLYYTPVESGFTRERGFNASPTMGRGLRGRKYPHDFLTAVRKEGFGRLRTPVNGCNYIRFNGNGSYSFAGHVVGPESVPLVPKFSAAMRRGQQGLAYGMMIETVEPVIAKIFGSNRWKVMDTGAGLHRWQLDLYWGEDEPLGPGRLMARPRGTQFEYGYSTVTTPK